MEQREIKFRVWDDKLKVLYSPDNQIGHLWSIKEADNGIIKYPDGILMQYTGLKDCNGKEIYEGDILNEIRYPPNEKGSYDSIPVFVKDNEIVVGFKDGCFVAKPDSHLWRYICNYNDGSKTDYEVIGNIYENPELLKTS